MIVPIFPIFFPYWFYTRQPWCWNPSSSSRLLRFLESFFCQMLTLINKELQWRNGRSSSKFNSINNCNIITKFLLSFYNVPLISTFLFLFLCFLSHRWIEIQYFSDPSFLPKRHFRNSRHTYLIGKGKPTKEIQGNAFDSTLKGDIVIRTGQYTAGFSITIIDSIWSF